MASLERARDKQVNDLIAEMRKICFTCTLGSHCSSCKKRIEQEKKIQEIKEKYHQALGCPMAK